MFLEIFVIFVLTLTILYTQIIMKEKRQYIKMCLKVQATEFEKRKCKLESTLIAQCERNQSELYMKEVGTQNRISKLREENSLVIATKKNDYEQKITKAQLEFEAIEKHQRRQLASLLAKIQIEIEDIKQEIRSKQQRIKHDLKMRKSKFGNEQINRQHVETLRLTVHTQQMQLLPGKVEKVKEEYQKQELQAQCIMEYNSKCANELETFQIRRLNILQNPCITESGGWLSAKQVKKTFDKKALRDIDTELDSKNLAIKYL